MEDLTSKELELIMKNEEIDKKVVRFSDEDNFQSSAMRQSKFHVLFGPEHPDEALPAEEFKGAFQPSKIPVKVAKANKLNEQANRKSEQTQFILSELRNIKFENEDLKRELSLAKSEVCRLKLELKNEIARSADLVNSAEKDTEIASLKRENQKLQDEIKKNNLRNKPETVRLNRQSEEITKLKTEINTLKSDFQDKVSSHKECKTQLESDLNAKDKQVKQLLQAYKKQMELIHVLRQQKLYLETCHVLDYTKEEFLDTLDWKPFGDKEVK